MLYSKNNEFRLITNSFLKKSRSVERQLENGIHLGIGDDGALITHPLDHVIAISTDTLVEGRHFMYKTAPADIAYKAFMVTISDLAAMGARPTWISLALTLPEYDESWIDEFTVQLHELCTLYNVDIIGGDTTKGPLTITLTVQGVVLPEHALKRKNAKVGDKIYISGNLGNSALGLLLLKNELVFNAESNIKSDENSNCSIAESISFLENAYHYPEAQVALGSLLSNKKIATSCIDISDGLASDLQHICTASNVRATIYLDKLPASDHLLTVINATIPDTSNLLADLNPIKSFLYRIMLTGGDDYQLCFTVPTQKEEQLYLEASSLGIRVTCIGEIIENKQPFQSDCIDYYYDSELIRLNITGFDHFI